MSGWIRILGLTCVLSAAATLSYADEGRTYTAEGVILGPDGEVIERAQVALYLIGRTTRLHKELTTGPDGKYAFSVSADLSDDAYGLITVQKTGWAWNCQRWLMLSDFPIDIHLVKPEVLAGAVVDAQGRPIAGAEVWPVLLSSERVRFYHVPRQLARELFAAETDSQGRFQITNLSSNWWMQFVVEAVGYSTVRSQDLPDYPYKVYAPGSRDVRFVLKPEAKISGVVVSETDGKPLAGIEVRIGRTETGVSYGFESAVSDQAGRFTLGRLPEGPFWVGAATSHVPETDWVGWPIQIQTRAGQVTEGVTLKLTQGGLLEATVVDRQGGRIAGAGLTVFESEGAKLAQGRTNGRGLCKIRLPAGTYQLVDVGKGGYHENEPYLRIEVETGETIRKELTLTKAERISGIVADDEGRPVSGAHVVLMPSPAGGTLSDKRGRFTMTWTKWLDEQHGAQSKEFELIAFDLAGNRTGAVVVSEESDDVRVVLGPAVHVTGVVVDGQGAPVPGALVSAWLRGSAWGMNLGRFKQLTTDRSGRFSFGPVHVDRICEVSVRSRGFETVKKEIRTPAEADRPYDMGPIEITSESTGADR